MASKQFLNKKQVEHAKLANNNNYPSSRPNIAINLSPKKSSVKSQTSSPQKAPRSSRSMQQSSEGHTQIFNNNSLFGSDVSQSYLS